MSVRIINADVMDGLAMLADESVDCVITDPPYGETSLEWDRPPSGWLKAVRRLLKPHGSVWLFGSMRSFLGLDLDGWTLAQDVIWEKHNGSNAFADRFRRVHEIAIHIYPAGSAWKTVYKQPLFTNDATARTVRRKQKPQQWGQMGADVFHSIDGGPRLMRSVMFCRSMHGQAEHPTQKPIAVMLPLIEYSCPPAGIVLDPFLGSGTTAIASRQLGRQCIGIELNPEYAAMAERRTRGDCPMFAEVIP